MHTAPYEKNTQTPRLAICVDHTVRICSSSGSFDHEAHNKDRQTIFDHSRQGGHLAQRARKHNQIAATTNANTTNPCVRFIIVSAAMNCAIESTAHSHRDINNPLQKHHICAWSIYCLPQQNTRARMCMRMEFAACVALIHSTAVNTRDRVTWQVTVGRRPNGERVHVRVVTSAGTAQSPKPECGRPLSLSSYAHATGSPDTTVSEALQQGPVENLGTWVWKRGGKRSGAREAPANPTRELHARDATLGGATETRIGRRCRVHFLANHAERMEPFETEVDKTDGMVRCHFLW